jgi:alpha-2-macroglobulin
VKGYVRILKHEKDTVVPQYCSGNVSWKVYDPRGAELENGNSKLNNFGSFDIKFTLKDNVNLGDARIDFTYNSQSHRHNFQIQEFRRPEFEAKCRYAPTSSHVSSNDIGGFFISSVKASYFAGGKFYFFYFLKFILLKFCFLFFLFNKVL